MSHYPAVHDDGLSPQDNGAVEVVEVTSGERVAVTAVGVHRPVQRTNNASITVSLSLAWNGQTDDSRANAT